MPNREKIRPLFDGCPVALVWSYLQGHMGYALADDEENPKSALIVVGDFCFLGGAPNGALAARAAGLELYPYGNGWEACIERAWGERVQKRLRYAIRREPNVFDRARLESYTRALPEGFCLRPFDAEVFALARSNAWSRDFVALFADYSSFAASGIGMGVFFQGELVSGASSYCVYDDGIEIEIDTRQDFRGRGLATACGAGLILACLARGLYPGWDAYDLRSVALAEKLGYHMEAPYAVYELLRSEPN